MCDDKNKTVTKTVRFIDLEAKNVLVEVCFPFQEIVLKHLLKSDS